MPLPAITTEPVQAEHAAELYADWQVAALYPYMPDRRYPTVDGLRQRLEHLARGAANPSHEQWLNWLMRDAVQGDAVGYLQATILPVQDMAFVGYVVFHRYWGRGYAQAGLGRLLAHLRPQVSRAVAVIDARNHASVATATRLGFIKTACQPTEQGEDWQFELQLREQGP